MNPRTAREAREEFHTRWSHLVRHLIKDTVTGGPTMFAVSIKRSVKSRFLP